jgi:hypothetical protein
MLSASVFSLDRMDIFISLMESIGNRGGTFRLHTDDARQLLEPSQSL